MRNERGARSILPRSGSVQPTFTATSSKKFSPLSLVEIASLAPQLKRNVPRIRQNKFLHHHPHIVRAEFANYHSRQFLRQFFNQSKGFRPAKLHHPARHVEIIYRLADLIARARFREIALDR